ncbi:MAG TPA: hypothetical protein DEQ77_03590, partial [Candidatus Omnitrophica bacterium]|nr:hypothetical protein [Candidatus Omnitrophota bacterium]
MRDIDYNFIPGRENRGNIDWVSRVFLIFPKTNPSDDGYINSGSPLLMKGGIFGRDYPNDGRRTRLLTSLFKKAITVIFISLFF